MWSFENVIESCLGKTLDMNHNGRFICYAEKETIIHQQKFATDFASI